MRPRPGATAVAESLQLQRMLNANFRDNGKRSIPIAKIEGIDVAEHPWDKMMGDKKPAAEPMAKLIPNDNYYIHFKNVRQFMEFSDLLDQWGTNLIRAYEVHSRDYRLKERYQQQLCLQQHGTGQGSSGRWFCAASPSPAATPTCAKAPTWRSFSTSPIANSSSAPCSRSSRRHARSSAISSRKARSKRMASPSRASPRRCAR